ncbi:uncharacterized protein METZ01_LOCUS216787 [marine metagenome]|uniref:Neck protein n=1 Tax=marine metagenome TaxID=408172 RepID=A0A382FNY4_9ZZZZ
MAIPNTKATLLSYCKRQLGYPVVEINVDDDQADDVLDDALQYFTEYHYDGTLRTYLKHQITQAEIDNQKTNTDVVSSSSGGSDSGATTWKEGNNYIELPEAVMSVVKVFTFTDKSTNNMFDLRYQLRLNDLYDLTSTSILYYEMVQQHLGMLDDILVGSPFMRHSKHGNRLYVDMDWTNSIAAGEYLLIEAIRKQDPTTFTDIYNDVWLKKYATAKLKLQWGQNLIKFDGIQMPGGVTLNGRQLVDDAKEEIIKLEEEVRLGYELPVLDMIG